VDPLSSSTRTPTNSLFTHTATFIPTSTRTLSPIATRQGGGNGQITFVSLQAGKRPQIWLINIDGTNPRALTNMVDGACQPSWSPDGARLVIVSPCARQQEEYPGSSLVMMNADGSNPVPLPSLPGGDFDPDWSPDGSQILFTSLREGTAHIFSINLADQKVTRLTGAFSDDRRPAWSADGKMIAFESTRLGQKQIWVMGAKGENQAEFTRLTEGAAFHPAWAADGATIIYNRDAALPWIFARRTDLMQSPEFHLSEQRPVLHARFSKDGQWLVYESWAGANHDIWIMRSNGTNRQAVTNDSAYDFDPVWMP
jgi:Tol biopolymer transport system component